MPLDLDRAGIGVAARVFIVDDDVAVLTAVARLCRLAGFATETHHSATKFLERLPYDAASCLILDLKMPDVDGLNVQEALNRCGVDIPIIFLSGEADVPSAATAMREGAVDFLVKPVDAAQLLEAVTRALVRDAEARRRREDRRSAKERLARLTPRERQVCELVAQGLLNKQIAGALGTSEKTIKVHRGRVMQKLEVDSVPALVRLVSQAS